MKMESLVRYVKTDIITGDKPNRLLLGTFTEEEHEIITNMQEPFKFHTIIKGVLYLTTCTYNSQPIGYVLIKKLNKNDFILTEQLQIPYMFKNDLTEMTVERATENLNRIFPTNHRHRDSVFDNKEKL